METDGRNPEDILKEALVSEGFRFDFHQAVRLIESFFPDRPSVAEGAAADREAVRFRSNVGFAFPSSEILEIKAPEKDGDPWEMVVNFLGLAGTNAPLPAPYTELIMKRLEKKDTAMKSFLDIFNHRLVSLFFRVRKIYRIGFDPKPPGTDRFSEYLYSLIGMGTGHLKGRMAFRDRVLLNYTALIARRPRSMSGLENILSDYFKVPVKGKEFIGDWSRLSEDQITRIGREGTNSSLGDSTVLGKRVWIQTEGFELSVGPLSREAFHDFLPGAGAWMVLCQLTRFYAGVEYRFRLRLILKAGEVPRFRLGEKTGPRLGWTAWLQTRDFRRENPEVVVRGDGS